MYSIKFELSEKAALKELEGRRFPSPDPGLGAHACWLALTGSNPPEGKSFYK